MTNPITGLVHVTGEPDTGKTTFALTCGVPVDRIAFFDDDIKGRFVVEEIERSGHKFGAYHNLVHIGAGLREIEFHQRCFDLIGALEPGRFDAVIWDTWTRFENTFHPWVVRDPGKFREYYSPMGTIKGAEQWKASFDYEALVLDQLLRIAPLVILTTHLKDHSIGTVKTGKEIPDSKKPLVQKSRLRLWLRHNPESPAPIGLVLKRISKNALSADGELETVSVLPRRMAPCTWRAIRDYWDSPIGDRPLTDSERPNAFELSILDGVLTEDQKDALKLNRLEAEREQQAAFEIASEEDRAKAQQARTLRAEGQSPRAVAEKMGVRIEQVIQWTA